MEQTQQRQLEKTLRRLHAGLKTFQMYSPSHTSVQITVQEVSTSLRGYLQRYGALAVHVSKDRLLTDGVTLSEAGMKALAFFLYVRNLASIAFLPGISDEEVTAFLGILSQDRRAIDTSGGVEHLISSQDLPHIVAKAMLLRENIDALSEAGIIDALTRVRRLSPEQREVVFSVLHSGPAAAASLFASVYGAAGAQSAEGEQVDVEHLLIALETLDRAILDEPIEDQEALIQNLAQGVLQLDERIRTALAPELMSQAVDGGSGRAILNELTGQEIALFMLGPVGLGEMAARLSRFLADLRVPEDKAAEATAFLQTALAAGSTKLGSFTATAQAPRPQPDGSERLVWSEVDASLLTFGPGDEAALELLRHEVSDVAVTRDAIKGLINLLKLQERPEEIAETGKALTAQLEFLADHQEFDLLVLALQRLQEARTLAEAHRPTIDAALTRVLNTVLLGRLAHYALQSRADVPAGVVQALLAIRDQAVPHMVRLLDREPVAAQRSRLCELLAELCVGRADLIGAYLPGASWYLTRNLVFVLGELRDPAAADHLARLAAHPEYRVKREAIEALRKIRSDHARTALIQFLRDPDPRIQYSLIEGADTQYDARIADWMLQVIRSPDRAPGAITAKVAAMKALARMRAAEALPLLQRIAGARWVFGQGRRTVREAARQVLDRWGRSTQHPT